MDETIKAERAVRRAVRLIRIPLLLAEEPRRAAELAELFGVSQRTINRDIELLRSEPFNLPLVLDREWLWNIDREELLWTLRRRPPGE